MTTTVAKRQNGNQPATFGNVVDNIFQNSLHRFFDDQLWRAGKPLAGDSVAANIKETNQGYEIQIVAPGCQKEAFKINVDDKRLTVSFENREENHEQDEKDGWLLNEYNSRSFSRSFALNDSIDVNGITASYTNGILFIRLPKNEKARQVTKNIEIQ